MAIPAASVGVKRLFNIARDILFYRRHYLKPDIIRFLIILLYGGKADLSEEIRIFEAAEAVKELEEILDDK